MRIKRKLGLAGIILGAFLFMPLANAEEPKEIKPFIKTTYRTRYIGATGGVGSNGHPVIQNVIGADLAKKNWNIRLDLWTNFDLVEDKINEADPEVYITTPSVNLPVVGHVTPSFYGVLGTFPNTDSHNTGEGGLNISFDDSFLNPNFYIGQTFGKNSGHGRILKGTLSKTLHLVKEYLNLSLRGTLTYNNGYFTERNNFSHACVEAGVTYRPTKNLEFTLSGYYQKPFGKFKKDLDNESVLSLGAGYSF